MTSDLRSDPAPTTSGHRRPPDASPTGTEGSPATRDRTVTVSAVPDLTVDPYSDALAEGPAGLPPLRPIPLPPLFLRRSGVYRLGPPVVLPPIPRPEPLPTPAPAPPVDRPLPEGPNGATQAGSAGGPVESDQNRSTGPIIPTFPVLGTEELRVDVDGVMPTMTVSGTITRLFGGRLTWLARVTRDPVTAVWSGPISYRDGTASLRPQGTVSVRLIGVPFLPLGRTAIATFSGGSGPSVTLQYTFETTAFRRVEFEYDTVSDATAVTAHNPASHPNHPASVPNSTLSLESAYARVGIQVTKSVGDSLIDITAAGANASWSDQEMHDAMQAHWSRWVDAPQWAVWVLFARLHDMGTTLGGIMFDDIGTAQRQGTAIFSGSFISDVPAGEASPGPYVERMRFWTAMHEIGHTFNLAHSWQKSLGTSWVPLADEPSALSYMNYPFRFPGGVDAFFAAFEYGFSPDELLFLRHAPERMVQMGAEPWFSNHGFEKEAFDQLRAAVTGPLELGVRVHREPRFEFLEPVVVELRLKNVSATPAVVDANALQDHGLAIVVARDGGEPKRWLPFARRCLAPAPTVLPPGEALYSSLFLSAGTGGWLIDEPGAYTVYAATDTGGGNAALSQPLTLVVDRPASPVVERLAAEVFTQEVAHTLAFGGSRQLHRANETLRQIAEQLPESRAAVHANAVLGTPLASDGKVLTGGPDGPETVAIVPAAPGEARELLSAALSDFDRAADSLGHIAVTAQAGQLADVIAADGDTSARSELLDRAADALARRGVLPAVVAGLRGAVTT
jgi:hypothetical protein